jgi:uncharacterized protein
MSSILEPTVKLTPQPAGMKHRFQAMVKPIGSLCNLNCTYCYYLHKEGLLHQPKTPRMSDEILEQHIRQYIEAQTGDEVVFSWQGGQPTHAKVMAAARLLKKHGVPFNGLCVVNRENARYPLDVYRFLTCELGVWRVQLISCIEPKVFRQVAPQHWDPATIPVVGTPAARPGSPDSVVTDWSVDPEDWGAFLCKVWDDWYARDFGKVHVDLFETAVAQSLGLPSQRCITSEFCGKGLAVEHNGDVFSCDHYVYPEYRLGNIRETHWSELAYAAPQQKFGFAKRDTLPAYCRECPHLKLCWGECPKNRLVRTPSGEVGLNYLCPGLKKFNAHIQRDMPAILRRVREGRNQ